MASLADLFNPTYLIFLGILVLVVALLVVYFESKMRDQNHKIASMLSLVSTLAEDMNGVKLGLNHLAIRGGQGFKRPDINLENSVNNLIEVSDDEESDKEESDNEESDDEESDNEETDNEESDDEEETNSEESDNDSESLEQDNEYLDDIKVVKLKVSNEDIDESYEESLEFEQVDNLDVEFEPTEEVPEIGAEYVDEILSLKYDETNDDDQTNELDKTNEADKAENNHLEESTILSSSDLKTISINLGNENENLEHQDNIDYKKIQLAKLRSIVVEKGLISNSEALKSKKPELLKLLGVE